METIHDQILVLINEELKKITGGLSDNLSLEDIAKKHKVSLEKIKKQHEKGIKVEMEHTDDKSIASKIAKDHLVELPDYYDRLEKIEK